MTIGTATVPKIQPTVYRAIIAEAHGNGMEVLAHLGRTSALADAKDLFRAGIDGFVHMVRDRDVDEEYLALVKSHPKVWTGPNMPVPMTRGHGRVSRRDPAGQAKSSGCARRFSSARRREIRPTSSSTSTAGTCERSTRLAW